MLESSAAQSITAEAAPEGRSTARVLALSALSIGALLRLFGALRFPFDQDELYTVLESRDLFQTTLRPGIDSRPLYYLLQHPLLDLLPHSEFTLRILPLLFGVLGMWATWMLARRWLGERAGAAAALLVAISPWHLYASTTARYYSLVYLCAAVALLLLTRAYDRDDRRTYQLTLATFAVGTLTHPSFVIVMAGAVLGLSLVRANGSIGFRWPSRRAWMYLWGPYLALLLLEAGILKAIGRSSAMANTGSRGLGATIRLVPAMLDWMTLTVFAAAIFGAILLVRTPGVRRRVGVMTVVVVTTTFVLLFLASLRTGVYADYGIGMLPLIFAAASASIVAKDQRSGVPWEAIATAGIVMAGTAPSTVSYLSDGLRYDYRPAFADVQRLDPQSAVLAWPAILRLEYAPTLRAHELKPRREYLDSLLNVEGRLWAVTSRKRYGIAGDAGGQISQWTAEHCRLIREYERPRFDYRIYRVELHRCGGTEDQVTP